MRYVDGQIWTPEGFVKGFLGFEDGIVREVGEGSIDSAELSGYILPTFVNAHTHLADYQAPIDIDASLEELVAPPHGLKHRYLRDAPVDEVRSSFVHLSDRMFRGGIGRFIDFREGGPEGAAILASIKNRKGARPIIYSRPSEHRFDREEVEMLLKISDGIGVSSISDWDYEELKSLADFVHSMKGCFAIHCSERVREDIDKVLDLRPSFLVHMTKASKDDLVTCRAEGVPIVVCPRSNLFFGSVPPLAEMLESGVNLALGTDNAMLALPDMFREMEFAARLIRAQGGTGLDAVLDMAIANPRIIINEPDSIKIRPGSPCDFMVLSSKKGDPTADIVLRSGERDVRIVCSGRQCRRGTR